MIEFLLFFQALVPYTINSRMAKNKALKTSSLPYPLPLASALGAIMQ
ncbi:MAG: hypothetical protein PHN68_10505 [Prolixibacteraceae bacterium]|jgi:hypothetical protein|nr:hypothetical protein [Prolixibacteraceae bacterium]